MRNWICIILFFLPTLLFAQNKGSIRGEILDAADSVGLESATVTVYKKKDSSLVKYQVTNARGKFSIDELPFKTNLLISISYTGYEDYSKEVYLDSVKHLFDFKKIYLLKDSSNFLDEVVVKSALPPIRMNEDTLEINPAAIKLDSNEVAEEVLLRVPGVVIWPDSGITVNGKKIDKLYVDGKPFFGGGSDIALKNLPKHAIQKMQVYQETDLRRDRFGAAVLDSTLVMDIKLKPNKRKGYFGDITGSIGTNLQYGSSTTLRGYNQKTQLGFTGSVNSIKKALGNLESSLKDKRLNVQSSWKTGLNFQHNFNEGSNRYNEKVLNGNYNISGNRNSSITNSTTEQNFDNLKTTRINAGYNLSNSLTQSVESGYQQREREKSFSLKGNYSRSNSSSESENNIAAFNNDVIPASRSANKSQNETHSDRFGINGNFNNTGSFADINKKSVSINYSMNYGDTRTNRSTYSKFESLTDSVYTTTNDRKYENKNTDFSTDIGISYNGLRQLLFGNYNLWNINVGLNNNFRYNKSDVNSYVTDKDTITDTYKINDALTNISSVANINNSTGLMLSKMFTKNIADRFQRTIRINTNLKNELLHQNNVSSLKYRNRIFSYNFFTPTSSIAYDYNKTNAYNVGLALNHTSSATAPTIDQLYPIRDSIDRYNIIVGNPNLKSTFTNDFSFNIAYSSNRGVNNKGGYNMNLGFGYNTVKNGIGDSTVYNDDLSRTTYYINMPMSKSFNTTLSAGLNIPLNKSTLIINSGGGYNIKEVSFFSKGITRTNNTSFNSRLAANVSIPLNKKILQVVYNLDYRNAESPQYINGEISTYESKNFNQSLTASLNVLSALNVSVAQSINNNNTNQLRLNNPAAASTTKTYGTNIKFQLRVPKNFTLSSNFRYANNISVKNESIKTTNWDAQAGYTFTKRKLFEFRVSVFNILGQNQNVNSTSSGNSVTTTISQGLQRYFLFTLAYLPKRFGMRSGGRGRGRGREMQEPPRLEQWDAMPPVMPPGETQRVIIE